MPYMDYCKYNIILVNKRIFVWNTSQNNIRFCMARNWAW